MTAGDHGYQAFRRSGQTGKTRAVSAPTTADAARRAADEERRKLRAGSSDTFEVRKPRKK
ncbi:hypothetical protein O7628_22540 [Micromonospora sp. WMMD956]|uniref:hypothetical protein n=1 Tax=Micromonospora TaxID=1873 RepID=UPI00241622BC|nr:hypothetical protein [Micromonospora sp. WMMD956]MDG4818265.1 hypothetical protein [Micromonospora sp. WMMD956]